MNSKGQIRSWIVILTTLLLVSMVFVAVTPAWDLLFNKINTSLANDSVSVSSLTKLNTAWQSWPLIFFFSMMLVGIVIASRQSGTRPPIVGGF